MSDFEKVGDIPSSFDLVTGSHERNHVLKSIGLEPDNYSHGSLFVRVGVAEYSEVYFYGGNVPKLTKDVTKLK